MHEIVVSEWSADRRESGGSIKCSAWVNCWLIGNRGVDESV